MEPGNEFEIYDNSQAAWMEYTGYIRPPRQVPAGGNIIDSLGKEAVTFSMGTANALRLKTDSTLFVLIETTLSDDTESPFVYYVSPEGSIAPAGLDGTWRGIEIQPGGTVLGLRSDTPEDGLTTYTIGLLLTSMSDYAIGPKPLDDPDDHLDDTASGGADTYGTCFISGLEADTPMLIEGMIVFAMIGLAVFLHLKRECR
jgi:hypothetical protein